MIVFEEGKAKSSDYRKFRIKTVKGANDYNSMREILTRRFEHGLREIREIQERNLDFSKGKFSSFTDLIMMDGGKGQVNVALEVLNELNIDINVDYRKFRIKTVKGANDYNSMREILTRRFEHGLREIREIQERNLDFSKGKFSSFPDLIMMDGGKGQVNVALEVLNELNIDINVCGLVKDDKHQTRGIIYNNKEVIINRNSNLMQLIRRIQDEVHRFAITYHRTLRDKRTLHSVLEDIPNVGQKRRIALLTKFGNVENIKKASIEELLETPTIDRRTAESIYSYFNQK